MGLSRPVLLEVAANLEKIQRVIGSAGILGDIRQPVVIDGTGDDDVGVGAWGLGQRFNNGQSGTKFLERLVAAAGLHQNIADVLVA